MHHDDVHRLITPTGPSPTIGEQSLRLRPMPVYRKHEFYDNIGRLHGVIVLLPIVYALLQVQSGQHLSPWFWWMFLATAAFAFLVRRSPYVRLSPGGISFPERKSFEAPWEQMTEAHARNDELDILLQDGQHVVISLKKMCARDVRKLKKLVKAQFQAMAERARASGSDDSQVAQAA